MRRMSLDRVYEKTQAVKALDLSTCTQGDIESALMELVREAQYRILCEPLVWTNTWHRGVLLKSAAAPWENNLAGFIYPPTAPAAYGRCNYPNQRVFYAAWNKIT